MFYVGQLSKEYSKFNWNFAWDLLGDNVIDVIEYGQTFAPVRSDSGTEYLGSMYELKDVRQIIELEEEELNYDD